MCSNAVNRRGDGENYGGLHQWNFDVRDGEFVLWTRVDVAGDVPLRYQAVDELNQLLTGAPFVQRALKRLVRGLLCQRLP